MNLVDFLFPTVCISDGMYIDTKILIPSQAIFFAKIIWGCPLAEEGSTDSLRTRVAPYRRLRSESEERSKEKPHLFRRGFSFPFLLALWNYPFVATLTPSNRMAGNIPPEAQWRVSSSSIM